MDTILGPAMWVVRSDLVNGLPRRMAEWEEALETEHQRQAKLIVMEAIAAAERRGRRRGSWKRRPWPRIPEPRRPFAP